MCAVRVGWGTVMVRFGFRFIPSRYFLGTRPTLVLSHIQ